MVQGRQSHPSVTSDPGPTPRNGSCLCRCSLHRSTMSHLPYDHRGARCTPPLEKRHGYAACDGTMPGRTTHTPIVDQRDE